VTALTLVETSLRDGNQSLWGATGLDTAMMLEIAPVMDRAGLKAIDFTTSTHMGVAVRFTKQDPWERIRLMAEATPNTPLQFLSTGFRFIAWETAHPDFMALAFKTLARNGIRRFAIADPMNDADAVVACARMVKKAGGEQVIAAFCYSISPVHDDAHYTACARAFGACDDIDAVYLKDPGGLLNPSRARTLLPAIKAEVGAKPLELHSHCTIGLADLAYFHAPELGVATVQCASGAAADGTSNPPALRVVANLRAAGHSVNVDHAALAEIATYFDRLAAAEGLPPGRPQGFDAAYMGHQLPGGMVTTLRRHLKEARLSHLEAQAIEEMARVRAELGYPIVMTPFSQIVLAQAVINLTSPERYSAAPDEAIRYALGRFGRPNAPIDPNVMDRIRALPRAKEIEAEPGPADLGELRKRLGKDLSDELLLLRATMPAEQVDAMIAAGPAPRRYEPMSAPTMKLVRAAAARRDLSEVRVEKPGFRLAMRKTGTEG
jgi:oxaloacetate decarboxylase alpha subunit